jgi:hypothetical protein
MSVYWIMFLIPLMGYIFNTRVSGDVKLLFNLFFFFFFLSLIGLRYQVGGDWDSYQRLFEWLNPDGLSGFSFLHNDYLYFYVNVFAKHFDWGIEFVNLVCAFFLVSGVLIFCNQQRNFFIALLVAVPYLFIVVGMGYTRQASAT